MSGLTNPPLAISVSASVYEWKDGQVLKLFHQKSPFNANELAAINAASAYLPVPVVIDGMIEVDGREGIVLERIDGPTMAEYVMNRPGSEIECATQMADLHAEMHRLDVSASLGFDTHYFLTLIINIKNGLSSDMGTAVMEILDRLPGGDALCHGDFYPNNIIMANDGPVIIDWTTGSRGSPLSDFASTWLLSRFWPELYPNRNPVANRFWQAYLNRYRELRSISEDEFASWQIVQAAARLSFGQGNNSYPPAVCEAFSDFVQAMLEKRTHPWLS